jgi:hypothetical protein
LQVAQFIRQVNHVHYLCNMITDKAYIEHPVFEQLTRFAEFYKSLANSIMSFISMGTRSVINIDTYVYSSMQGTLESIHDILLKGHINDAYALLRKFYDATIINIYTNLYLDENFTIENFVVEKIEKWLKGKEQLPDIRGMKNYIQHSTQVAKIYELLQKDKRYTELRDRCNDHTHYNFYFNVLVNDGQVFIKNRIVILDKFSMDLENIIIMHLSYLFYFKEEYMMSSDYVDSLDCGLTPEPDSQYFVAPFVQEIFDTLITKNRADLSTEIKKNTIMRLK